MSSGKIRYIINDIYDIIVMQLVYTDVVHRVSYGFYFRREVVPYFNAMVKY